jgi:hypothetical protein
VQQGELGHLKTKNRVRFQSGPPTQGLPRSLRLNIRQDLTCKLPLFDPITAKRNLCLKKGHEDFLRFQIKCPENKALPSNIK